MVLTIEQAEAELIRVLDEKVAAGFVLLVWGGDGIKCGCALQALPSKAEETLFEVAGRIFGWSRIESGAFVGGFDGSVLWSEEMAIKPGHAALGKSLARRYGVR